MASLKGILFCILLFLSSTLGIVFFAGWNFLFFILSMPLFRKFMDFNVGFWECYCASLVEYMFGVKIVITGDKMKKGEKSLIIMNHRTRLDWMFFWSVLVRQSGTFTEKIILKAPLKHIPGAGWAMQCGAFVFLNRNFETDKGILDKMLDYFAGLRHNTQMLLFPEGTDYCPNSKKRSDNFAKKNNLPVYEYVLHPRITGFTYIYQKMKQADQLDVLYDVTVGYPCGRPQGEKEILLGDFPKEVHFHITRHEIATLPSTEAELSQWCTSKWQEKEGVLKKFYEEKKFKESARPTGDHPTENNSQKGEMFLKFSLVFWSLFIVLSALLLYYSNLARWFFLAQTLMYLAFGFKGGFEQIQADLFRQLYGKLRRE